MLVVSALSETFILRPFEMETKRVDGSLILRKIAALEKGDLTDCTFLVGPDDQVQEIHACKFDLVVASEYFQGVLRSPLTPAGPIRIKHVEPEIFRLVVEFTHTSGQLVSKFNDLEQCLKLAAAADEFLLEELGQLCTEKLEELINVDNVWTVFDQNHLIKYISSACEKLLSSKTEECLRKPGFLEIDENTLTEFLNLEKLNIKSEMELVSACLEFVKGKEDERALFRRCALPHLRLLTLSADDDLSKLVSFLDQLEKVFLTLKLAANKDPLLLKNDFAEVTSLCNNYVKRQMLNQEMTFDLLEDKRLLNSPSTFTLCNYKLLVGKMIRFNNKDYVGSTFTLTLIAKSPIRITGFDIMCQVDEDIQKDRLWSQRLKLEEAISWKGCTKVFVTNMSCCTTNVLKPKELVDLWAHFETSILLAKGDRVKVEVTFDEPFWISLDFIASSYVTSNSDLNCRVQYQQYHQKGSQDNEPEYLRIKPSWCAITTIFKSFSYERV